MVLWGDLARKDVLPVTWVEPSVLFSYPSSLLSFVEDIRTFNPFKAAVSRPGPPELPPPPVLRVFCPTRVTEAVGWKSRLDYKDWVWTPVL